MKKFRFLVKYGLFKRVKRKSFVISNVIIFILLTVIINLPTIINAFGEDEITNVNVVIYNETTEATLPSDLTVRLNAPYEDDFFLVTSDTTMFDENVFWDNDVVDIVLIFNSESDIEIYSKNPDYNQYISSNIELLFINYQIPGYQAPAITVNYPADYENPETSDIVSSLSSLIALPVFFLITMATQFVGVDIIEEKSTKAIETIIASVPAKTHFLSKISAAILFVGIQGLLILGYGFVATLLFGGGNDIAGLGGSSNLLAVVGEAIPNWQWLIVISLAFMIVGTLFYLVYSAMFASMAVTQEDYQQFQAPIMMTLLIGFYIAIFSGIAGGDMILKVATFIPIFAPVVAPVAFASGALTIGEAMIALGVTTVCLIGSLYLVSPVYKVAILNYDQTKFAKRIKGYFRKAFPKKNTK